jgi:hypothetical protein
VLKWRWISEAAKSFQLSVNLSEKVGDHEKPRKSLASEKRGTLRGKRTLNYTMQTCCLDCWKARAQFWVEFEAFKIFSGKWISQMMIDVLHTSCRPERPGVQLTPQRGPQWEGIRKGEKKEEEEGDIEDIDNYKKNWMCFEILPYAVIVFLL